MLFFARMVEKKMGNIIDVCLGSDSILKLDGRNNLNNMVKDCKKKMKSQDHYIGFRIYQGHIRESVMVYHEPKDFELVDKNLKNNF